MAFQKEETEEGIRLHIQGSLSIYEASALRDELLGCLDTGENVEVALSNVKECDTAGLQLLVSARKSAESAQKQLHITNAPEHVLDLLYSAGIRQDEVL
ncbi:MAG: STAS domain-containing protein [Desulfatiglandaceae bacterium]